MARGKVQRAAISRSATAAAAAAVASRCWQQWGFAATYLAYLDPLDTSIQTKIISERLLFNHQPPSASVDLSLPEHVTKIESYFDISLGINILTIWLLPVLPSPFPARRVFPPREKVLEGKFFNFFSS